MTSGSVYDLWLGVWPLARYMTSGSVYDLWLGVWPLARYMTSGSVYDLWQHEIDADTIVLMSTLKSVIYLAWITKVGNRG